MNNGRRFPGVTPRSKHALGLVTGAALLSACGGGGGGPPTTPPPPATTVTPTPPPVTPPPAPPPAPIDFNSSEYRNSNGAVQMNALTAYQAGATGGGVTVAVLDSGVDINNSEFAGRIHANSRDIAGTRSVDDEDGHGTSVSAVIAAARNDAGMHGVAFGSTLLALRTDEPGSCASNEDGCQHNDNDLARAFDLAVASGARVVNMSLGGSPVNSRLRTAIANATRAGVVVVISAGNDGNPNPDPLAQVALDPAASNGLVVIAGATDGDRQLAQWTEGATNHAGIGADFYIAALGTRVRSYDHSGQQWLFSGTSYAAPNVAGAIALLLQSFPNLTPAQVIDLLFRSADDAGAAGTDADFGRGILNIGRAFQPQGATSLPASATPVATTTAGNATMGGAMGDGGQLGQSLQGAVVLDGYGRAFALDLAATIAATPAQRPLASRLTDRSRSVTTGNGATRLSVTIDAPTSTRPWVGMALTDLDVQVDDRPRVSQMLATTRLSTETELGFATGFTAETLVGQLDRSDRSGSFLTSDPLRDAGFAQRNANAAAMRQRIGAWTLSFGVGRADVATPGRITASAGTADTVAMSVLRRVGPMNLTAGIAQMRESDTVLGSRTSAALGLSGAVTRFASLGADIELGNGFSLGAGMRHGWTKAGTNGLGLIEDVGTLRSFGFEATLTKYGLLANADRFSFRVAQPLRVSGGSARLNVPVDYHYSTLSAVYQTRFANLAPSGREIDVEAAYALPLWGGQLGTHLFWRRDPGHIAEQPDDVGAALRFSAGF